MDHRDYNATDPELEHRAPNVRRHTVRDTLYSKPSTKICYFYKDGDVNFRAVRVAINSRRYGNLDNLKKELTGKIKGLPFGVRSVYTPGGNDAIDDLERLQDNGRYVCSTYRNRAQGVDVGQVNSQRVWRMGRPPSARRLHVRYLSDSDTAPPPVRPRFAWRNDNKSTATSLYAVRPPKKIYVLKNGDPTVEHVVLLNRRTAQNFEQVLSSLGDMFQMPARRLYTLQGRPVSYLLQLSFITWDYILQGWLVHKLLVALFASLCCVWCDFQVKSLSAIFNGPEKYVVSRGERFQPLGALTDPGPHAHSVTPSTGRNKYQNDIVARKLREKRDKLAKTRQFYVCSRV